MKRIYRILIIFFVSLVGGIIYNQLHPAGITFPYLLQPVTGNTQNSFRVISADSSFIMSTDESVLFVDTRMQEDYALDHIHGAVHARLENIHHQLQRSLLSGYSNIIFYDQEGEIDKMRFYIKTVNFPPGIKVWLLYGGYLSWMGNGFPYEEGRQFYGE